jgi:hypothetical protein
LLFIVSSCKKLNEASEIGGDVIPGVDGVNTFDTSLTSLQTFNHIFEATKDSAIVGLAMTRSLATFLMIHYSVKRMPRCSFS